MATLTLNTKIVRFVPRLRPPMKTCVRNVCGSKKDSKCKKPFENSPCGLQEAPPAGAKSKPKPKFESMWPNPFCEGEKDPFCPFNPRFDDLYYIESDKAKRKYWQTWVACPPVKIKKKKICCYAQTKLPPIKRREAKKPKTACPVPIVCREDDEKCPRLKRRCHKAGRIPPSCQKSTNPADCDKPLAPYPAFSECLRLKPGARPLSECLCWSKPMLCEIWAEWRKRNMAKKAEKMNKS